MFININVLIGKFIDYKRKILFYKKVILVLTSPIGKEPDFGLGAGMVRSHYISQADFKIDTLLP